MKFILDVHAFEKLARQNPLGNTDQQTAALTLFHRYLSIDANYFIPIDNELRQATLCNYINHWILWFVLFLVLICPSSNSTIPDPDCFRMAREYAWNLIEQTFVLIISKLIGWILKSLFSAYPAYLSSAYHVNYQLKMLTSNQLQLHDILYNSSSLSYFIEVRRWNFLL